jgi:hypothetical protein
LAAVRDFEEELLTPSFAIYNGPSNFRLEVRVVKNVTKAF